MAQCAPLADDICNAGTSDWHRRAVLSSWTASREESLERSPLKFSQGATRREEILKRAGLQQGGINIFQINEVILSRSREIERYWKEGVQVHVELLQLGLFVVSRASAVNV